MFYKVLRIFFLLLMALLVTAAYILQKENKNGHFSEQQVTSQKGALYPVQRLIWKLRENSGIVYYNNLFWTFNDSGFKNILYSFDTTGQQSCIEYEINNAGNVDWEDITQDSSYFYIGDFGNNFGSRRNLVIYKISKAEILSSKTRKINSEAIRFTYPDQQDFTHIEKGTSYDCEAMFYYQDQLYLLTKDWIYESTKMYTLPTLPGEYTAKFIEEFVVEGLVTAADMRPDKKMLAILGYKDYIPFLYLITDFVDDGFFDGTMIRYDFYDFFEAQTEGVAFHDNGTIFISAERSKLPAQLYRFDPD